MAVVSEGDLLLVPAPGVSGKYVLCLVGDDIEGTGLVVCFGDVVMPYPRSAPLWVQRECVFPAAAQLVGQLFDSGDDCATRVQPFIIPTSPAADSG